MKRKIIRIDEQKCVGCGLCADACQEGAIAMVDGKAKLVREDYCDGLGNCLPACPAEAISFEEREAPAFDAAAVAKEQPGAEAEPGLAGGETAAPLPAGGCPGTRMRMMARKPAVSAAAATTGESRSELRQWPCQIKLVSPQAPYFADAHLLIAADCTAYAYAGFHERFIRGKIALIGCPKLDAVDYTEKLTDILASNSIKSVTVVRMEVPCCAGLADAAIRALQACGKMIPWQVVTLTVDGQILPA